MKADILLRWFRMYCAKCGKELKDKAIRCVHCGYYVEATDKGPFSTNNYEDFKESTFVFKFWSMHPLTIILSVLYILYTFFSYNIGSWFLMGIAYYIGYYMARDWAPRIQGSQSWAFAIGFFFSLFGLFFYWLYYRSKLDKYTLNTPQQMRSSQESNPRSKYSEYWNNKGVEFSESNHYENALEAYNQALAIDDQDPEIWNQKCYILIKLGRYEEAITAGKCAVNLAPQDPVAWDILRNAYLANHNPEKVSECSNKISALQTGSAQNKSPSPAYSMPQGTDFMQIVKIGGGLLVVLFIVIAALNYRDTLVKNTSGTLYGIFFSIFLIGIMYEGWKAVSK